MNSRLRIVLASLAALAAILGILALGVRVVSLWMSPDIEPIPAPGPRVVNQAVRRPVAPPRVSEEVVGVGLAIRVDPQYGAIRIMKVIANSPAALAGLREGWVIDKIDNQSTAGVPLRECVDRLRGLVGTKVRLEVISPELDQTNVVELTRQRLGLSP